MLERPRAAKRLAGISVIWLVALAHAVADDHIALFVVDNAVQTPFWQARHPILFRELGLGDQLKPGGKLANWGKTDRFQKYRDADSVRGYVYAIDQSGGLQQTYFVTINDVFDQYVADKMEKYRSRMPDGVEPTLEVSNGIYTVRTPEFERTDRPGARSAAWASHLKYVKPVMMNAAGPGSLAKIRDAPASAASELLKDAIGKMWYLNYRPQGVPRKHRIRAFELVLKAANIGLQRRDDERVEIYELRRLLADTSIEMLRSLAFDVTDLTAFTEWPQRAGDPYLARIRISVQDGSPLSKLIRELRPTTRSLESLEGNLGNLNLNLTIPKSLRSAVAALITTQADVEPSKRVLSAIDRGKLRIAASLASSNDCIQATFVTDTPLTAKDVTSLLRLPQNPSSNFDLPALRQVQLPRLRYSIQDHDDGVILAVANTEASQWATPLPSRIRLSSAEGTALLKAKFDFRPLISSSEGSWTRKTLQKLEGDWTKSMLAAKARPIPGPFGEPVSTQASPTPKSILHRVRKDSDWTVTVQLRTGNNSLQLDIRIGFGLHAFWQVRQRIRN